MDNLSFLFLGANSPWTYGLAEALAHCHRTEAIEFYDWRTYYLLRPTWSSRTPPARMHRAFHLLPPGYAGRLEPLFRPYLQQMIRRWCQQLQRQTQRRPWVIVPHPYLTPWVRHVPAQQLIYYNFDDYTLYRPERKEHLLAQEQELIDRAQLILCASSFQQTVFQKQYPHRGNDMYHLPHGFADAYLNPQPDAPPQPMTVGYVGNLGDRLDWRLIEQVIRGCPEVTFQFVGGRDDNGTLDPAEWQPLRERVLTLPNVHAVGKVPADRVAQFYWTSTVNWIPYRVDHPFNQAACPTKIMDGIASCRPVVSSDLPECRLYPDWISIFHTADEAIVRLRQALEDASQPEARQKSIRQRQFAQQNTWQARAQAIENWLSPLQMV